MTVVAHVWSDPMDGTLSVVLSLACCDGTRDGVGLADSCGVGADGTRPSLTPCVWAERGPLGFGVLTVTLQPMTR